MMRQNNPRGPAGNDAAGALPPSPLETMHPSYFAMVMASGIVSIACHLLGMAWIGRALLWANVFFYIALWALLLLRCARYGRAVKADLLHHGRSVGFFTLVAATCVLGSQFVVIAGSMTVAVMFWYAGVALWLILTYGIITLLTVTSNKPGLAEGINGGWLLPVVAAQSVSVLGAQVASTFGDQQAGILFFCLVIWLGAGMLYIWIISLIFYRYTFFALSPSDLAPPYWINMGAVAISTLAGTMLLANADASPLVTDLAPFIKGFTLFFWSTATSWVPMLIILGVWRHGYRRFPLRYDPLYWGAVFPLGMYTVCTFRLARVLRLPVLESIAHDFIYAAMAAWILAFAGLLHHLIGLVETSKKHRAQHAARPRGDL